ncbi:MAG TPA: hypothetical protein VFR81_08595 [Longimicrobium sp.]|nr:hypothetical protein [Longimicrobium sp.]
MLHITSGDSAAGVIHRSGLLGEILIWDDMLHDGPVPARLSLKELSAVRARHLRRRWRLAPWHEVLVEFAERDRTLSRFRRYGEVVLWFEPHPSDQFRLAQLLDWFAARKLGTVPVTTVGNVRDLRRSTPEQTAARFRGRVLVSNAQLALGRAVWAAFRSPDPMAISLLLDRDMEVLPWMAGALRRHLQEFPSIRDGLAHSERQVLASLVAGPASVRDLFLAHHRRKDPIWLGDSTFVAYLHDLAAGDAPLLRLGPAENPYDMRQWVEMTDAGRAVLDGREDRVRLCGIDRWLGGVHLRGHAVRWRWSPEEYGLVVSDA